MVDTARSAALLTRLRVSSRWFEGFDGRYDRAARTFPLVGALLALPIGATAWAAVSIGLPPLAAGLLAVGLGAVVTGALHEDGLADTADSLGGRDRAARLSIMRDSAVGAYGMMTLIVTVGLRASALGALGSMPSVALAGAIAAMGASRASIVWLWGTTRSAREGGAAARSGRPTRRSVNSAVTIAMALAIPALVVFGPWPLLLAFGGSVATATILRRHARRALGGHTGDVLGACAVLVETVILLALAAGAAGSDMGR